MINRAEISPGVHDIVMHRRSLSEATVEATDRLAVEEPLEIVLRFRRKGMLVRKPISITMRTPGQDLDLAVGFLFTEGIIESRKSLIDLEQTSESSVTVSVDSGVDPRRLERHFYTTSSCGVCGKTSLAALRMNREIRLNASNPIHTPSFLLSMPAIVRSQQSLFEETGGIHAAALFNRYGQLLLLREDVGRHNAMDKMIGAELLAGRADFSDMMVFVTGRAGFELVQKSLSAAIPFLAAVGAPSSLSVLLAREYNSTLIGFLRESRFNIYSGFHRVPEARTPSDTDPNLISSILPGT